MKVVLFTFSDFVANATLLDEIERDWLKIAPELLDYTYTVVPGRKDETSKRIKEFYMKDQPISRATTGPFIQVRVCQLWRQNSPQNSLS